jgi:hypothetical protein
MAGMPVSKTAWTFAVLAFGAGLGLTLVQAADQGRPAAPGAPQDQRGRQVKFEPAAIKTSKLKLQLEWVGRAPSTGNLTSPVVAGNLLLFINQHGSLDAWDGTNSHSLLNAANLPAAITPIGSEVLLNVAADGSGSRLYVMFTSSTVPGGIPQRISPRPGADAWHVLYGFDFDGTSLSNPAPITALQVRSDGHTGGGLTLEGDTLLFSTGDNGDSGEDGRQYAQDAANHLGKIVLINVSTGATEIAAVGVRNIQRLVVDANAGDPHLVAADIGGLVAEEIDAIPLGDLLWGGTARNGGWGRNAVDAKAREGTFYIDVNGVAVGSAPVPEAGFVQPIAQFGRERAELVAVTGPVTSADSFRKIRYLVGDLVSGSVYALTAGPATASQSVYRVTLIDSASRVTSLQTLAGGGRPDPRFFNFPDGSAGVLLEATGDFYRLTEVR